MGTFVLQSLYAADGVILPLKAGSAFSVEGLLKAVRLISRVRAGANPDLTFLRLLINQTDRRTSISRDISREITGAFEADQLFHTTIPVNTAFELAEARGQTIFEFNPRASGARAFEALAAELLNVCGLGSDTPGRTRHEQPAEKEPTPGKTTG
jgi:chromosome partitioning protein